MTVTIIARGDGFMIERDTEAHSGVPYGAIDRPDGERNHGFVDLADRPDLACEIPEAQRSSGLLRLLQVVNAVGSRFRTLGCECGLFPMDPPKSGCDRYIGSYISIVFRDAKANSAERIEGLARSAMAMVAVENTAHRISYQITITPLRTLFGRLGCYELHVNAIGAGHTDEEAWAAFATACLGLAHAFEQLNRLPAQDLAFD